MGRKKKRRRSSFGIRSIFKYLRIGALLAPAIAEAVDPAVTDNKLKVTRAVRWYTGFNMMDKTYNVSDVARGWLPYVVTVLLTYGVSKLAGIIRRL